MDKISDGVMHFIAGVGLAVADRRYSKNARRYTDKRIEEKEEQYVALDYVRQANSDTANPETLKSKDYLEAIVLAKKYFRGKGEQTEKGFAGVIGSTIENIRSYSERINPLKGGKKLALAYGIELAGDLIVEASQTLVGVGSFVGSLGKTTYQGFALWGGLQAGKFAIWGVDKVTIRKQEKDLDAMVSELTSDGKLLTIVRNYSATSSVKDEKTSEGANVNVADLKAKAGDIGTKVGEQVNSAIESAKTGVNSAVEAIKARVNQRSNARRAEEERRKGNYKNLLDRGN